jgi:ABC-type bacteriocin/lantibiotic exporter with double-glycine peptidase domain
MQLFKLLALVAILLALVIEVTAQEKYDIKQVKFLVYDKGGYSWNDKDAFLGVRLDATKAETLEDQEISSSTTTYSVGSEYQRYALKFDTSGNCYSDINFIVYKNQDKLIYYEIALLKKEGDKYVAVPLSTRSYSISRTTPDKYSINTAIFRPLLLTDWLIYLGIMLASMGFIYFSIFRWLFTNLLFKHNWPVSRAEYFTTSLSLLLVLAVFGLLMALFLPQTVVVWTILVVLTVFWAGHAITWALS